MKKLCVSFFCLMLAISIIGCGQKNFDDDYVVEQYQKEKEKEEQQRIKEQEEEEERLRKEQEKKEKEEEKKAQEEEKERQKQEEKERKESEKAEKEEQKKAEEEQKKLEKEQKKSEKEEIKKAEQEEKEKKKAEQEEIKKAEQEEKDKKKSEKENTTSTSSSVSQEEPEPDENPEKIVDDFLAGWNGSLDVEIPRYVMKAAYSSIIERVYGVITGATSGERSDAGVSEACLGKSQTDNLSSIGYAFVNLDGDTLLEMVIIIPGSGFGQTYKVVEVYSLDNTLSPVLDGYTNSRTDIDVYAKYPQFDSKISNLEITYFNSYK